MVAQLFADPVIGKQLNHAKGVWLRPRDRGPYTVLIVTKDLEADEIVFTLKRTIGCCLNHWVLTGGDGVSEASPSILL